MATHIEACFACRRRLPIAIGDSVVREIERVDPEWRRTDDFTNANKGLKLLKG
jgi:hypothetical protein